MAVLGNFTNSLWRQYSKINHLSSWSPAKVVVRIYFGLINNFSPKWEGKQSNLCKFSRGLIVFIKKIASKHIKKEKAIEAKTGKKTRLPKMSKLEKTVAMAKEKFGLSK